jgi:hypothetical protein
MQTQLTIESRVPETFFIRRQLLPVVRAWFVTWVRIVNSLQHMFVAFVFQRVRYVDAFNYSTMAYCVQRRPLVLSWGDMSWAQEWCLSRGNK